MSTEHNSTVAVILVIIIISIAVNVLRQEMTTRDTPRERHCIETLSELFNGFDVAPSVCNDILYSPIK